jgi:hypothetical protein
VTEAAEWVNTHENECKEMKKGAAKGGAAPKKP